MILTVTIWNSCNFKSIHKLKSHYNSHNYKNVRKSVSNRNCSKILKEKECHKMLVWKNAVWVNAGVKIFRGKRLKMKVWPYACVEESRSRDILLEMSTLQPITCGLLRHPLFVQSPEFWNFLKFFLGKYLEILVCK